MSAATSIRRVGTGALLRAVVLVARLLLGGMLLWSSIPKLQNPYALLSSVYDYELVGPQVGLARAVILPWLELVLATCLIAGILELGAFTLSTCLFLVFALARASVAMRGLKIPCGCAARTSVVMTAGDVWQAGLLLLICLAGLVSKVMAGRWSGSEVRATGG